MFPPLPSCWLRGLEKKKEKRKEKTLEKKNNLKSFPLFSFVFHFSVFPSLFSPLSFFFVSSFLFWSPSPSFLVGSSPLPFWFVVPLPLIGGGSLPRPILGWVVSPPFLVGCPPPSYWWGVSPSPHSWLGSLPSPFRLDGPFLVGRSPRPSCLSPSPLESHHPILGATTDSVVRCLRVA